MGSCPRCGATNSANARFCGQCGQALDAADATFAAPEQATIAPSSPAPRPPASASGWLTSSDSISHGRFAPGTILDGRYRIIGLLGRGGMGEVYRADDLRLGQPVALKFLPDTVARDPMRLAQFHNEVRTARQVAHPNICRVYDIGDVEGQLFLSMELVDGEDLATSVRRIGRFAEDKATDIARQLCAGLAAAHERGVIHRDLKPANVMLDGAGKVRVMDFGLAAAGAVEDIRVGTPAYMAPEQLLGKEVTARSDIYALGLVLYELFTGRRAFTASTLNDLIEQHQSGEITPPSAAVSTLDPAIERAILRCLDREPTRRPASALAVAAALPGGDPLAAALAAGETPSPEMVAAAGEGAGLRKRVAVPVFAAIVVGIAASYAIALQINPLEQIRPELNADVLAQKARETARALGYTTRPQDEAYGFEWNDAVIEYLRGIPDGAPRSASRSKRPSPLAFWYRRSQQPLIGLEFHSDLLTPGIVTPGDPVPTVSEMVVMRFDHHGFLTLLEAIPPQVQEAPAEAPTVDWTVLHKLAGLDPATLQPATPQWHWLAASDTRAAWTGVWPESNHELRVEAAALYGRPVAFLVAGPWTTPWRTAAADDDGGTAIVVILFVLALAILIGAAVLARKNLREGRGDRAAAVRLGVAIAAALWASWLCEVHLSPAIGLLGVFLLAVCTTTFYGVLFWTIYLAVEPLVRRYWPQTLVSWTTLLGRRARDPIVGRDVLFGVLLGVAIAVFLQATMLNTGDTNWVATEQLGGLRSVTGALLQVAIYAVRTALFFFFLMFLLRVLLRNQWLAAAAFVVVFASLEALESTNPTSAAITTATYCAMVAFVVVRWGLTTLAVGAFVGNTLLMLPATTDPSAWYVGATLLLAALPLAIAAWAFYTAVGGRVFESKLLT